MEVWRGEEEKESKREGREGKRVRGVLRGGREEKRCVEEMGSKKCVEGRKRREESKRCVEGRKRREER